MEQILVVNPLETDNDVWFGIACTILSYSRKKQFNTDDIIQELKETYNWSEHVFEQWDIKKMINISLENLAEHGKLYESPRWYELRNN